MAHYSAPISEPKDKMVVYGGNTPDEAVGVDTDTGEIFEVELCSKMTVTVMTAKEKEWFEKTRDSYLEENKFSESTDLQDVDRLLILELQLFRWTMYIAAGRDYDGIRVDEDLVRKQIKEVADSITKVKNSLGLDKAARDKALNEGNFHEWFTDATRRAKAFGVHRQNQLNQALALFNEISATVGAFYRSNEEERVKLGYKTEAAIVEWIRDDVLPRYHEVDEFFVNNEQSMWARDL